MKAKAASVVIEECCVKVIRSLDIFVVLSNVNLIGSHFVGGMTSLGLLEWVD